MEPVIWICTILNYTQHLFQKCRRTISQQTNFNFFITCQLFKRIRFSHILWGNCAEKKIQNITKTFGEYLRDSWVKENKY